MPGTPRSRNPRLPREESGFTLIEALVTLIVIAVLLAIAIPSFLGFEGRASKSASRANLRTALPALAAYHADNDSYAGMTIASLKGYDQAVSTDISVLSTSAAGYCLRSIHNGESYYKNGPGGDITATPCS